MSKYKIIVATHKEYEMPKDDLYLPVHLGAAGKKSLGYQRDDEGENISNKNSNFCELTGLYWAYKNLTADYWGLVHYRRYFKKKSKSVEPMECILGRKDLDKLTAKTNIILPKKQHYYIETLYSHYSHTHNEQDLIITRDIIKSIYPEYLDAWDSVMKRRSAHMFNMFIMKREYAKQYCDWLFQILFALEEKIDLGQI